MDCSVRFGASACLIYYFPMKFGQSDEKKSDHYAANSPVVVKNTQLRQTRGKQ